MATPDNELPGESGGIPPESPGESGDGRGRPDGYDERAEWAVYGFILGCAYVALVWIVHAYVVGKRK